MQDTAITRVRNFAIAGHAGAGKTTLADRMLATSGKVSRMGSVANRTSASDYRADEQEKQASIYTTPLNCQWLDNTFYFLDTPGNADFYGDTRAALSVVDMALIVVDAVSGLEFGTARAWRLAGQRQCPRAIFISNMDRDNADYFRVLEDIQEHYGRTVCVPFTLPVGAGGADFREVLHVLRSKIIPEALAATVEQYRSALLDTVAESDESLMLRYLDGEDLTEEEISEGLHHAILDGSLVPVFCGSALADVGVTELMNGIVNLFPHPTYRGSMPVVGGELTLTPDGIGKAHVFKTLIDQHIGQLSIMRVYSGCIQADSELLNDTRDSRERIGQLLVLNGQEQTAVPVATPGMIVGVAKLKDTHINDTVSSAPTAVRFLPIEFPRANMSYAIYAIHKGEEDKIASGLHRLLEEDPTVRFERNEETHELVLYGLGDQHLRIFVNRLKSLARVDVELRTPRVPYRETITSVGSARYRHKKQSGGHGQFAEVSLRLEPLAEEGFEFVSEVVGGSIPKNYLPAVEKGIRNAMARGPLAHCHVTKVRAVVVDGKHHDVDSSDMAFQIAARAAFREAMRGASPILMEPMMQLRIITPEAYMGDITADLSHHRGRILGISLEEGMQVLNAEMPLSETFAYATQLRSITHGRGTFEVEFGHYEAVPVNIARSIQEAVAHDEEDDEH